MNPYYEDDLVTLYHGDALETMAALADDLVQITVTSPPYNMGLTPGGNGRGMYPHTTQKAARFGSGYSDAGDDSLPHDEYVAVRQAELQQMWRCSSSSVWWNHRPRIVHGALRDPLDGEYGLPLRQRIILARPTGIDVNLSHFATRGEYLLLFAKPTFTLADHAASGMGDVWPTPIVTGSEHPAPFDESVPERCITATGATSVLDPFVGSGTTLVVAKRMGVRAIGIERSERFCELTAARLGSWQHAVQHDGSLWSTT